MECGQIAWVTDCNIDIIISFILHETDKVLPWVAKKETIRCIGDDICMLLKFLLGHYHSFSTY